MNPMNLLQMPDHKLAALRQSVVGEIARRAEAAANGHDPAGIIFGNEAAKRALVVAAAGQHSILLFGPASCGKTMLRAVALRLGLVESYEARTCPCGNHLSPRAVCRCSARQVERHLRKLPIADISVEVCQPKAAERRVSSLTLAVMERQIAGKGDYASLQLDESSASALAGAVAQVGLSEAACGRIVAVARTIANLDQSERIRLFHLLEAVNYRPLGR